RLAAYLLGLPVISVSMFSWLGANPFNGAVFGLLASAMMIVARRLPSEPVPRETTPFLAPGALLIVFGWMYPHFVQAGSWLTYVYAAPFGLLPCPTLSVVLGLTLALELE